MVAADAIEQRELIAERAVLQLIGHYFVSHLSLHVATAAVVVVATVVVAVSIVHVIARGAVGYHTAIARVYLREVVAVVDRVEGVDTVVIVVVVVANAGVVVVVVIVQILKAEFRLLANGADAAAATQVVSQYRLIDAAVVVEQVARCCVEVCSVREFLNIDQEQQQQQKHFRF